MNHTLESVQKSALRLMSKPLDAVLTINEVSLGLVAIYLHDFEQEFCDKDGQFFEYKKKVFANFVSYLMGIHQETVENFVTVHRQSPFFSQFDPIVTRFMFYTANQPCCLFRGETKFNGDHRSDDDPTAKFGYTVFSAGGIKMAERYWYSPERPLTSVDPTLDMSNHINLTLTHCIMRYAVGWGTESPQDVFESPIVLRLFPLELDPHDLFWALRATVSAMGSITEGVKNLNVEVESKIKEFLSVPKGEAHE